MGQNHFLILGGARSGKSLLGERLALHLSVKPAYVATARVLDEEMRQKVDRHKERRKDAFVTVEEPVQLAGTLKEAATNHDTILVDCLTLWLTNLMLDEKADREREVSRLFTALETLKDTRLIFISNEVGLGIVPQNGLSRDFRDEAGDLHQKLAAVCGTACVVVAGLPVMLKGKLPDLD